MQLNLSKRVASVCAAAGLMGVAGAGLATMDADAHFSTGQYTYKYRDSSTSCRHHVDPINTVFYGSYAFARSVKHNIIRHMAWRDQGGSFQYFATHGYCYGMDFQQASDSTSSTRYHIRGKQGKDRDSRGRYETVGDAHHEDFVFPCGHAVDSNGSQGSGFDQGRRQIAARFRARGHQVKYQRWGNTEKFKQCDGDTASSDGLVAWVQVTHFKH